MGIIISQYKDPYKPISIMECHKGFERCSHRFPPSQGFSAAISACERGSEWEVALSCLVER